MTKEAYMSQLKKALEKCMPEFRAEILADYEEYFRGGLSEGKTEEEICLQLGNIEDFVREIPKECYAADDTCAEAASVVPLETTIVPPQNNSSYSFDIVTKVILHTGYTDAYIYCCKNRDIQVEADIRYDIRYENNECTITLQPTSRTFMGFFTVQNGGSAEICIPDSVRILEIHGACGDVEIENLRLETLQGDIGSGDQTLTNIFAKSLYASSASGDIELTNCCSDSMTLHTSSGDITCEGIKAPTLSASSASGDIEISNSVSCTASLSASAGDICYYDKTGNGYQANIKSCCGDYSLYFGGREIASGSGQNHLSCGSGASVLDISTSAGDIEING